MVKIMHRSKSKFYLSEINSAASKNNLSAICNKLLAFEKIAPFQNIYLIDQLPAIFNDFIYQYC